ncbi:MULTISPECIES: hypothetical protein [Haloferax]|uniref:Uncharacterized protein n=1 Tax=Haloferax marinum TaxID=2666143 RepID=A0A6A8GAP3_9EURY|nr:MULTISPECIES: hypothetical protein [Haloferax]KAB1190741.1 hypothetical protein Hfx1150_17065 [Haloferax sp. CBA1150]MRW98279.1 hypothetical protein [Haloferax marinum]
MTETPDVVASLESTAHRLDETRAEVEAFGKEDLQTLADALEDVDRILGQYESRATDRDDLEGYIEFRDTLSNTLDEIPVDVPHSEAFIEANEALTTGITSTLSASDFEHARTILEPARESALLLESWQSTRKEYRTARRAVEQRKSEIDDRIDELQDIVTLGEADLDAPTDTLADPIEAYNEAVTTAFHQYLDQTPACEVLGQLEATRYYPLVELPTPPQRLQSYLETVDVGSESISRLVELAEFSRSKLDHYVDDSEAFSSVVGTNRTYLSQLAEEAEALTVPWPPEPAREVKWRARELVAVVGRFADEATVVHARKLYRFASNDQDEFDRLRATAVARQRLTEEQRTRLKSGAIEAEIEQLRTDARELQASLEQHEPRH